MNEYPYYCCPKCGWNTCDYETEDGLNNPDGHILLKTESMGKHFDSWSGATIYDWIEYWKCPDCDTEFDFLNGN